MKWFGVALVLAVLTIAPVQAGSLFPTPEVATDGGECSINRDYVMGQNAPEEGRAYSACSLGGAAYSAYFTHVIAEDTSVAGPFQIAATIGCELAGASAGAPGATSSYRLILHVNGQSSGNINGNWDNVCLAEEFAVSHEHNFGAMDLPAGSQVRLQIMLFYTTTSANEEPNFYVKTGEASTLTAAGLYEAPLIEAPAIVYENLTAPVINHAFTNATSGNYVFNFTSDSGFGLLDLDVNGTGFANATLVDGNGTEVFNSTLVSGLTEYQNFTAGTWQLNLTYTDFNGTLDFEFLDGQSVQPEPVVEQNMTVPQNETVLDAPEDGQEAPGLALPLAITVIAGVALRRRKQV